MEQVSFYQAEVKALSTLISSLSDDELSTKTAFKQWTINDIIGHLYVFDTAALLTLSSEAVFDTFFSPMDIALKNGRELVNHWLSQTHEVITAYNQADPKQRLKWAGPSMSARSSITARHMETWSHGHTVFDALQQIRTETDRVYSVCHLGVATFAWTFMNRQLTPATPPPKVELTGPSGAQWVWNADSTNGAIQGDAVEFAQVVTQVRNIGDTKLAVTGQVANQWMNMAQCFAGPPVDPPTPGSR